jgi:HEAT repeat protein
LGDEGAASLLEAFLKSQFLEDRITAVQAMGRLRTPRSAAVLRKAFTDSKQDPTVRVAAAGSLGMLGESVPDAYALLAATEPEKVLRSVRGKDAELSSYETFRLQGLALLALGHMGNPGVVDAIHPLLKARAAQIRVAAADAIVRLLASYKPAVATPAPRPAAPAAEIPAAPESEAAPATAPADAPTLPAGPTLHTSGGKE